MLWGGTDVVRYLIHQVRPIVVLTSGAVEVQTMIYCQRCKKANPNEADHCEACGAFLLVITRTPDSMPGESIDNTLEEHLLERISALESALVRSNERFEQLLEIAQQQATGSFYDHMMLESLTELLTEKGGIDSEELEFRWRGRVARHYEETAERERLDDRCEKIIAAYRGRFRDDFAYLVEDGIDLLAEGNAKRGLKMLESALRLDDQNVELQLIIGEYYFTQGKSGEAGTILARTLEDRPDHFRALLLLGLLNGENGEDASARARLEQALARESWPRRYPISNTRSISIRGRRCITCSVVPTRKMGGSRWRSGPCRRRFGSIRGSISRNIVWDCSTGRRSGWSRRGSISGRPTR